jgi:spore coat polysaccharide biosynthesis predicted glycosyltransferase SpsG
MRVLLRADATQVQGTGHVMRSLTLAEALISRGHHVTLLTNESGIVWLEQVLAESSVTVVRTRSNSIDLSAIAHINPLWVVVDSYQILAEDIARLRPDYQVLAIVDGDDRGIEADLYLDHNLGAELEAWRGSTRDRLLAGSEFALIRDAILRERRRQPWVFQKVVPHIVAVMGGSDPTGAIVHVAQALSASDQDFTASIVTEHRWRADVEKLFAGRPRCEILAPTAGLPAVLGSADIAVSAAGTSAWELCTLGVPSLLIAVVENQREPLLRLADRGLVLGMDVVDSAGTNYHEGIIRGVDQLLENGHTRKDLSDQCLLTFDGTGKDRVVAAMESGTRP